MSNFQHFSGFSEDDFEEFVAAGKVSSSSLAEGVIAEIVRAHVARTCLSCGAKEAADGTLPCNH